MTKIIENLTAQIINADKFNINATKILKRNEII